MVTTPIFLLVAGAAVAVGAAVVAIVELVAGSPRSALEERRRADLRQRAPFDKRAARQLRERLQQDLARQGAVRRDLERDRASGTAREALLRDIARAEQATRNEIARIEQWINAGS